MARQPSSKPKQKKKAARTVKAGTPASRGSANTRNLRNAESGSKKDVILELLRRKGGASVEELVAASGWKVHSVRGFPSGTVKTKLGLPLSSERPEGGKRRYFLRGRS